MQGLRERGYVEGRNLVIEYPDALGREDRLPELAADLVRKQVDVILIIGPAPLDAARKATNTIPLVMVASSADPVAEGVALSLARPRRQYHRFDLRGVPIDSKSSSSCSNPRPSASPVSPCFGISTLRPIAGIGKCLSQTRVAFWD